MASSHHHQLPELFPFNPVSSWLLLRLSATACLCKCLQCFVCLTINTLPIITREHYGASHDTIPWWMMSGNGTIVGAKYSLTYWSENLCVCLAVAVKKDDVSSNFNADLFIFISIISISGLFAAHHHHHRKWYHASIIPRHSLVRCGVGDDIYCLKRAPKYLYDIHPSLYLYPDIFLISLNGNIQWDKVFQPTTTYHEICKSKYLMFLSEIRAYNLRV